MKRNKLLALLLVLVLAFSFALVACNQHDCAKDGHEYGEDGKCKYCGQQKPEQPGPGPDVDVPVEEGKVTLYFTMADDSVALPSYASVFFAGGQTGFATGLAAPEFKNLAGTKTYYIQIAYDATKDKANEYQLVVGYNTSSGCSADKCGLIWDMSYGKSDECEEVKYPDNPKFTYAEGAKKVNLGVHKWSTAIPEPVAIDVDVRITFSEELGENAEVYIMGGFNGWDVSKAKASPLKTQNEQNQEVTDRSVWSISLKDVICGDYQYKVLVYKDGSKAENLTWQQPKKDAEGNPVEPAEMEEIGIWDRFVTTPDWTGLGDHEATDKLLGYTVIAGGDQNLPISIVESDALIGFVDLAGTISETALGVEKTGIDLSTAELLEGKDTVKDPETEVETKVPNGKFTWTVVLVGEKTLKVEFDKALDANVDVYALGAFRMNEAGDGWGLSLEDAKMTVAADRLSATIVYDILPGTYDFNLIFVHKDIELKEVQGIWDNGSKLKNEGNESVTISGFEDETVALLSGKITVPEVKPPVMVDATLTVSFSSAVPAGKTVLIAGSFEGFKGTVMTPNADRTTWSLLVENMIVKEHKCQVAIVDVPEEGSPKFVWSQFGGDKVFEVEETTTTLDVYGEVLDVPGAPVASVTFTITFSTALAEGQKVFLAGTATSWTPAEIPEMTANADRTVFTITLTNLKSGVMSYKVCVGESFNWDNCLGANAPAFGGSDNATLKLKVSDNGQTVKLFADVNEGVIVLAAAE